MGVGERNWQGRGPRGCASSYERVAFALQPQVCDQESFLSGFWASDCSFLRPLCTCLSGKTLVCKEEQGLRVA